MIRSTPRRASPGHLDLLEVQLLRADERFQQPAQPLALGGAHPGDSSAACAVVGIVVRQVKGYPVARGVAVRPPLDRGYARLR